MDHTKKNTVLLLGHNRLQEHSLMLTLKLGGFLTRIFNETNEMINAATTMPQEVRSIVLYGFYCQRTLKDTLEAFVLQHIAVPVFLVGNAAVEFDQSYLLEKFSGQLNLSCSARDQLLADLSQLEG